MNISRTTVYKNTSKLFTHIQAIIYYYHHFQYCKMISNKHTLHQWRSQKCTLGTHWGFPYVHSLISFSLFPVLFFPLEVEPPKIQLGVSGNTVSFTGGVWG